MTLDDLREALLRMETGQCIPMSHALYAELFPPGEPDEGARGRAFDFVHAHGCRIDNRPHEEAIAFVKNG